MSNEDVRVARLDTPVGEIVMGIVKSEDDTYVTFDTLVALAMNPETRGVQFAEFLPFSENKETSIKKDKILCIEPVRKEDKDLYLEAVGKKSIITPDNKLIMPGQ